MTRVLTNSPFGVIVRLFSGGRLFTPTEQRADFTIPWPYQLASDKNNNKTQEVLHSNNDSALLSPLPVDDKMSLGIDNEAQKSVTTTPQEAQQEQDQEQSAWIPPEVTPDGAILVDWFSADDPDNPQNWSFAAKLLVYIEVCLFTFMVYMSAAVFSAASGEFEYSFGTTRTVSSLGLALYVLGYGMGPMIWSPMSEIPSIGRNPPCVTSVTFFLIISVPTAIVNNAPGFFVLRFLQGFFGSPGLATGGASLADVAGPMSLPYGLYAWSVCSISGPALGPTISGFSVPVMGWRWSMWEIVWAAGLCFAFLIFLPKTSAPAILHLRAKRLRKLTGNPNFRSLSEIQSKNFSPLHIAYRALVMPWKINALDPAILFTTVYVGLVYAIFYSYFEVLPLVYLDIYNMTLGELGLIFLACFIGGLIVIPFYFPFIHLVINKTFREGRSPRPETRLIPGLFGSILVPVGLLLFAWTARETFHWAVPTVGLVVEVAGMSLVIQCIFNYLSVAYPMYSASLFAMNDLARASLAFAAILWSNSLYNRLGVAGGTTLLAGLTVGCVGGIFVLYWFGPTLRKRSRFAK